MKQIGQSGKLVGIGYSQRLLGHTFCFGEASRLRIGRSERCPDKRILRCHGRGLLSQHDGARTIAQ